MIYVVGAGYMAREYARVLKALGESFLVVGRGEQAVQEIRAELKVNAVAGGLTKAIAEAHQPPQVAIVCTPIETLCAVTLELLRFGVRAILLEKPGGLSTCELNEIKVTALQYDSTVHIGYNRRFYQATLALQEHLKGEELIAANFEITEWSQHVVDAPCSYEVKQKWVLSNSSHVIDLVMHIAGSFSKLSCYSDGGLAWHSASSRFVGSGLTDKGVLFSYCGYWDGPGRWSAEFITTSNRYILRPMEKLQVQKINSVTMQFDESVNYSLDIEFKPGLFLQTKAFLAGDFEKLVSIDEQMAAFEVFEKIANY